MKKDKIFRKMGFNPEDMVETIENEEFTNSLSGEKILFTADNEFEHIYWEGTGTIDEIEIIVCYKIENNSFSVVHKEEY